MSFINDDFMLRSKTAKHLFFDYAKDMPIIDYHCHLNPQQIAEDYKFADAFDLFLGGDHYKWRQMRSNGIDERYITGGADGRDKFMMWAKTLPLLIGNPLYHWMHLELKRYFDIDEELNEHTAEGIWQRCNSLLSGDNFSAKALIRRSGVEVICTTDDPSDSLEHHQRIKADGFETAVLPTFRPDKAVEIGNDTFVPYVHASGAKSYADFLSWIDTRIEFFHENGCRLSDHGLGYIPFAVGGAAAVFEKRMNGGVLTAEEADVFKTAVLQHCGRQFAARGWVMQLHLGALRNNNSRMFGLLGADAGFDSMNDLCIAEKLSAFMNSLEVDDALPKTILYTMNPKDNYVLGTMLGNFQKPPTPGKIQFGSGWWFNDQRDGMEQQMKALANLGILGRFVGMLTDSRSFVSYPRHEYFRRIFCNMIGEWVENGEYPRSEEMLERIVKGVSCNNAKEYFDF